MRTGLTLALFSGSGEAAAALATDGVLLAAVHETQTRQASALPYDAAASCLAAADARPGDVTQVIALSDQCWNLPLVAADWDTAAAAANSESDLPQMLRRAAYYRLGAQQGQTWLTSTTAEDDAVMLVCDDRAGGALVVKRDEHLAALGAITGTQEMGDATTRLAQALGCRGDPWSELEALARATGEDPGDGFDRVVSATTDGVAIDFSRLDRLLLAAQAASPFPLNDTRSPHRELQRVRASVAAGFLERVVEVLADLGIRRGEAECVEHVALGGALFSRPHINARISRRLPRCSVSPAPFAAGAVLGAAIGNRTKVDCVAGLALGARFTEYEIKTTLDNCRLDYVYEPDLSRLHDRISTILAAGLSVAWFQGAADFGTRSLGSRSVVLDPCGRYARENVNVYLLGADARRPIPLSLAPSAGTTCLADAVRSPFMLTEATIKPDWREKLQAAMQTDGTCVLHTPNPIAAPEFCALLDSHYQRTNAPGLLNVSLTAESGGLAVTPRQAVRTAFGSAVDVLVIGRFLASKDYWLLRGQLGS
jgi:predicted NodU family carbamoyl transferase